MITHPSTDVSPLVPVVVSVTGACACMGPPGDCPCVRRQRGEVTPIAEIKIHAELFALLTREDQQTINTIKMRALDLWMRKQKESRVNDV